VVEDFPSIVLRSSLFRAAMSGSDPFSIVILPLKVPVPDFTGVALAAGFPPPLLFRPPPLSSESPESVG